MECEESRIIERIISHGFEDFTGHDDMVYKVTDLIYNWAYEVIIIENAQIVLKAMTLFFRMAINIINKERNQRGNYDNLESVCMRYCGF